MYEQAGGAPTGAAGTGGGWNVHYGGSPGGGFRTMSEDEMREMFGNADPFSDFFHTFFGGSAGAAEQGRRGRGGRGRAARPGRDIEHELTLSLEDAYQGAMRPLSIKHEGHARSVDVRIPPGVGDGSRLRVGGEGELGTGGAASGDLYLRIRLAPHPVFERKAHDLYMRAQIPLTTAVLGGETTVQTLGGKSLRLKIPPMTQNGQVFRLKGHGMPVVGKPGQTGDLYATVDVQLPRTLTPAQRRHFEALQQLETDAQKTAAS
jgi:DnaJ-class molecular chaperone